MDELKGKKLLILGSTSRTIDFVNYAREMGVYSIVTDWNDPSNAPVKLAADEHWEVSLMDYDELAKRIKTNHVDGVITGFTDSYLLPYQHLCEICGLPYYATKELLEKTLDKSKFKKMCRESGVPVVPEYTLEDINLKTISQDNKVIIKPVDNSGSRGIIICDNPIDFHACVDYSLNHSSKKQVIIEKYVDMDSISMSYTIQDGVVSLSTINDSIIHKSPGVGGVTCGSVYPSKYTHAYIEKVDPLVRRMLSNNGFVNGVLFIQAFTNGADFYLLEMGYRLSGGRHYVWTEYENDTNAARQLIHFAITGKMADYNISTRDTPLFKDFCCRVYILGKEATIARIEGEEYLRSMPQTIDFFLNKGVGDTIGPDGTTAQQIAIINFVAKDKDDFDSIVKQIENNFHVYDAEENDLVLNLLR